MGIFFGLNADEIIYVKTPELGNIVVTDNVDEED